MTPHPMNDTVENRRKRLMFRSTHRGCKEMDIILGRFAETHLRGLDEAELTQFEAILEEHDADIYDWISGKSPLPADMDTPVMRRLLAFDVAEHTGA